jgi:hypothetical protein
MSNMDLDDDVTGEALRIGGYSLGSTLGVGEAKALFVMILSGLALCDRDRAFLRFPLLSHGPMPERH